MFKSADYREWYLQKPGKAYLWLALVALVLLLTAYLSHLGYLPVDPRTDENRRALVTLEMMHRGDYIVPTLNGVDYLNKPPLYNWIIAVSYKVFGVNAFALRFPVILFLFLFGTIIYAFLKKQVSQKFAILAALFFITNGRILFYDGLLGLIDIAFSGMVYLSFIGIYHWGEKKHFWKLFLLTWLATALAFLMKGIPALFFQATSLLIYFGWKKEFRRLLSLKSMVGLLVFLLVAGGYYAAYFLVSNVTLSEMFGNMLNENTKRTVTQSEVSSTLKHVFSYPFSWFYHFAPWAIMAITAFRKDFLQKLRGHDFMMYNALVFLPGFFIYWLSPNIETAARYYFMLVPVLYTVSLWIYLESRPQSLPRKIVDGLLWIFFGALLLGVIAPPFIKEIESTHLLIPKSILLAVSLGVLFWLAMRKPNYRLLAFVLMLGFARMAFNSFVVENRGGYQQEQIAHFETVIEKVDPSKLFLEKRAYTGNTDGFSYLYMLRTGKILQASDTIVPGNFYITGSEAARKYPHRLLYRWPNYVSNDVWLVEATR